MTNIGYIKQPPTLASLISTPPLPQTIAHASTATIATATATATVISTTNDCNSIVNTSKIHNNQANSKRTWPKLRIGKLGSHWHSPLSCAHSALKLPCHQYLKHRTRSQLQKIQNSTLLPWEWRMIVYRCLLSCLLLSCYSCAQLVDRIYACWVVSPYHIVGIFERERGDCKIESNNSIRILKTLK